MDASFFALYPFVSEASDYVGSLGFSPDRLISSRALESARLRGKERVLQSLGEGIVKFDLSGSDEGRILSELLSYPFARVLVSCIDDQFLIHRYVLSEAIAAARLLNGHDDRFLSEFALDFSIDAPLFENPLNKEVLFKLHFTDYIKLATSMKDLKWKLVNRKLSGGVVKVAREDFIRLLQEAMRMRILENLPLNIPEEMKIECGPYLTEVIEVLQERKERFDSGSFGKIEAGLFPPCMTHAIARAGVGVNLAHSMRFALTAFLSAVGMNVEQILNIFNVSPDFDESKTRYQVEHITGSSGTQYKPPSCSTMKTYGNCHEPDELCKRIKHPLSYYQRRCWMVRADSKRGGPERDDSERDDSERDDSERDDSERDDPKRDDPKRDDSERDDPKRDDPKRDDPKRDDPKRDDPKRDDPKRDDSERDDSERDDPKRDDPKRDDSERDDSERDDSERDDPKRDDPKRDDSGRDGQK